MIDEHLADLLFQSGFAHGVFVTQGTVDRVFEVELVIDHADASISVFKQMSCGVVACFAVVQADVGRIDLGDVSVEQNKRDASFY